MMQVLIFILFAVLTLDYIVNHDIELVILKAVLCFLCGS